MLALFFLSAGVLTAGETAMFDVRDYGAVGDGKTLDTEAVHKAIAACAAALGGQVVFPRGTYLSGTVLLKSNVALKLEEGARLTGSTDLTHYRQFTPPAGSFEARLGKWHRALILGEDVENVAILGPGTIDGNKVFDPQGEEKMRGPHTILFGRSKKITLADFTVRDSANYAIALEWCDDAAVSNVKITGGWDGVHFRASADRPCRNLRIAGCQFRTGDDAIAGRYVENLHVEDCRINSSCNGMRIIGPVGKMTVRNCRFFGPGVHPHRTSGRKDMLSGILLQPGAWDPSPGALEDVTISDVTMQKVASPVSLWLRRPGNAAERISICRLKATGVYRAAASVESWSETAVGRVEFRDVSIEYEGGGTREQAQAAVKPAGLDSRPLPAWGFYARNVKELLLHNVQLTASKEDLRHVLMCESVERLTLDKLQYPQIAGAAEPLLLRNVKQVRHDASDAGESSKKPTSGRPNR